MPQLRWLNNGFLMVQLGSYPRPDNVGFVVDKVKLRFSPSASISPANLHSIKCFTFIITPPEYTASTLIVSLDNQLKTK
jgi:hypothetical protein